MAAWVCCVGMNSDQVEEQQLLNPPGAGDVVRLPKELPKGPRRAPSLRVPAAIRRLIPAVVFGPVPGSGSAEFWMQRGRAKRFR